MATAAPAETAAPARKSPRPARHKTFVVKPVKGTVRVVLARRGHGKAGAVPKVVTGRTVVPVGSTVDVRNGTARIATATNSSGSRTNAGRFSGTVFALEQPKATGSTAALSIGGDGPRVCRTGTTRRLNSVAERGFIVLAGPSASGSKFGRSNWASADRCNAAAMKVRRGAVKFGDIGNRRTSAVRAIRRYRHRGLFTTRGRYSTATVRGRVVGG